MFRWSNQPEPVPGASSTANKLLAGAGVVVSFVFMIILLVPGSPAQLTPPSFIAMGVWALLGLVFYLVTFKRNRAIDDDTMDVAVLGSVRPAWVSQTLEPAKA